MNKKNLFQPVWKFFTPVVAIFFACVAVAQDEQQPGEERFLFVFSTAPEMKERIPATQKEVNMLLLLAMMGELREDDTVGVWTFNAAPHAGQFPLVRWQPDAAEKIASAVNKFIKKQSYSRTNNYQALNHLLDKVVQSSPRLTILIFCDGETDISGTPYDADINQVFSQRRYDLKNSKQPFVVVLRVQDGKYVGTSVNYSSGMVSLPPFPSLPTAPMPPPVQAAPRTASPEPASRALPLIIIGTNVETNWQSLTNLPPLETSRPIIQQSNPPQNETAPVSMNAMTFPTNVVSTAPTNSVTVTNAVAAAENSGADHRGMLVLAAGFLMGAVALGAIFIFGSRRGGHGSLISDSMKK